MKKRFLTLMVALCLMSSCAAAESQGILYRVTGGKNEMTLLGSIHIGSEEMYPFGESIMQALENADTLVFECDTESAEAAQAMLGLMSYPVGETLKEHVSAETYEAVEAVAKKLGYPISMFNAFKPWTVVSLLSVDTTAAEMGTDDVQQAISLGVEAQVAQLAEGKQIAYLETTLEQLEMMDGFSPALQEYMLLSACNAILHPENLTGMDATLTQWPDWWRTGNAEAFAQSYLEGNAAEPDQALMEEYHQNLCAKRNVTMAQTLVTMLESDEERSYFVTVGLLHLVLPQDSIVHELQKLGYTVERIAK